MKKTPKSQIKRSLLAKSLAGNDLDLILITNFESTEEEISQRKAIILTARVHPGETNSSFIMQGIIDLMVSSDRVAKFLRNQYVFKIIPMLNPDGVVIGNYRCSLSGLDLNRQYLAPNPKITPEISGVKDVTEHIF
jgi:cytosolic carboxypeptidase protein 2/3